MQPTPHVHPLFLLFDTICTVSFTLSFRCYAMFVRCFVFDAIYAVCFILSFLTLYKYPVCSLIAHVLSLFDVIYSVCFILSFHALFVCPVCSLIANVFSLFDAICSVCLYCLFTPSLSVQFVRRYVLHWWALYKE